MSSEMFKFFFVFKFTRRFLYKVNQLKITRYNYKNEIFMSEFSPTMSTLDTSNTNINIQKFSKFNFSLKPPVMANSEHKQMG